MPDLDIAVSVALGVGLAAATGFRVFLPMLVVSIAANTGHLPLADSFAWIGTPPALILLGVAAIAEILGYYIPGVDNLLDTLATPAALVAGTIISAAVITDLPPTVKWATAVIAGGGIAGLIQSTSALLRAKSTVFTGGLGNPGHRHHRARRLSPGVDPGARRAADRASAGGAVPVARAALPVAPHAARHALAGSLSHGANLG